MFQKFANIEIFIGYSLVQISLDLLIPVRINLLFCRNRNIFLHVVSKEAGNEETCVRMYVCAQRSYLVPPGYVASCQTIYLSAGIVALTRRLLPGILFM